MREFLPQVRRPGRYIGPEPNAVVKPHDSVKVKIALVYPDLYEIGIANMGIRILYEIINGLPYALAERAYLPGKDMETVLKRHGAALSTMETDTPLDRFDIIGITLQTELNFPAALQVIGLAGLKLHSSQRPDMFPLIIGGGSCAFNPEPVADFFDAFLIGDGEQAIKDIADTVITCREKGVSKQDCLESLAGIEGVYVPCLYKQSDDKQGMYKGTVPLHTPAIPLRRRILPDIGTVVLKNAIVPFIKPVHDRLVVEIARGCTKSCRFCQAGMIYRPVREKNMDTVLREIKQNVDVTGFSDVSLLSLSAGDYSHIHELLKSFMSEFADDRCSLSLPSLRIDSVTGQMLDRIKQVRKTGLTVAIEAGTQRLRDVINKNISEEDILSSTELAAKMGWQTIKLYFMIGLPSETDDDLNGMAAIIRRIHAAVRKHSRKTRIHASISPFVPKPHTPFQWAEMITPEEYRRRLSIVKNGVRNTGVVIKQQQPEISIIEAVLARGDRRMAGIIEEVAGRGMTMDSSENNVDYGAWYSVWLDAIRHKGLLLPDLLRQRSPGEPLPWDHLDTRIPKSFLLQEYNKALEGKLTPDCFQAACVDCGVCDFKLIEPVAAASGPARPSAALPRHDTARWSTTVRLRYAKTGLLRFLGHLELIDFLMHVLHRSGLPLVYSAGFHPKPVVSFSAPLPVGIASEAEYMDLKLYGDADPAGVLQALQKNSYDGLEFLHAAALPYADKTVSSAIRAVHFELPLDAINSCTISVLSSAIDLLLNSERFMVSHTYKNKSTGIDIRPFIDTLSIDMTGRLCMVIKRIDNRIIGPVDILEKGLAIPYYEIIDAPLRKVKVDFGND